MSIKLYSQEEKEYFMKQAIQEAKKAEAIQEVPIGAVVVLDGQIVGRGYNQRESQNQSSAHAEMLAIQAANSKLGRWRLSDCDLFVTLEPCAMCSGALVLSRMRAVYYGASDPKGGAGGSLMNLLEDDRFNHQCLVESGILKEDCSSLLSDFFRALRLRKKAGKSGHSGSDL